MHIIYNTIAQSVILDIPCRVYEIISTKSYAQKNHSPRKSYAQKIIRPENHTLPRKTLKIEAYLIMIVVRSELRVLYIK